LLYVLFVCKCVLPPGDNPIAVNKYIIFFSLSLSFYSLVLLFVFPFLIHDTTAWFQLWPPLPSFCCCNVRYILPDGPSSAVELFKIRVRNTGLTFCMNSVLFSATLRTNYNSYEFSAKRKCEESIVIRHYKAEAICFVRRVVLFGTISVHIRIFPSYIVLGKRFLV
jgi:hypothetical protein